jgi:hypothetical protein
LGFVVEKELGVETVTTDLSILEDVLNLRGSRSTPILTTFVFLDSSTLLPSPKLNIRKLRACKRGSRCTSVCLRDFIFLI